MLNARTPASTTCLLHGLHEPGNQTAWRQFDDRYRPIIVAFARQLGLGPADAADVAQETLACFLRDYRAGRYERDRGRLVTWIVSIARHRVADVKRVRAKRREIRGISALDQLPDEQCLTEIWEAECRRAVLAQALSELQWRSRLGQQTIEAFRMLTDQRQSPGQVAQSLGIPLRAVYLAKYRCINKLREIVAELNRAYELQEGAEL